MSSRAPLRLALITLSLASLVWLFPTVAPAGMRHAGTVLVMGGSAGTLILGEYWVNGQWRLLTVRITPDTQVVLSERDEMFKELTDTFTTTPIRARGLRIKDFVVVELVDTAPDNVASLVMVTHPETAGS